MSLNHYKLSYADLDIPATAITNSIGYTNDNVPEMISKIIEDIMSEAVQNSNIQGGYRLIDNISVGSDLKTVKIDNVTFGTDKIIGSRLIDATSVALFTCSAGPEFEAWSQGIATEGDTVKSYILDLLGTEIVECAMDKILVELQDEMNDRNLGITNRYSPGYCNWDVSEQHLLFSFLPENFCNVSLTDSAFMKPTKSISGIIGIGPDAKKVEYECHACDINDCILKDSYKR